MPWFTRLLPGLLSPASPFASQYSAPGRRWITPRWLRPTGTLVLFTGLVVFGAQAAHASGPPSNFGSVAIGSSTTQTFTFTFTSAVTLAAPAVLTQGVPNEDFTDAGTGTCTTNGAGYSYSPGSACTVSVTFKPLHPGLRLGAVQLYSSGNVVATTNLYGVGVGPQAVFLGNYTTPSTFSLNSSSQPAGLAVDGVGDVFVADYGNDAVEEIVAISGQISSTSAIETIGSGFSSPMGVAVDGSGDVFVADYGNGAVKEVVATNGQVSSVSAVSVVGSGFAGPSGIAVDGSGDVFVADAVGGAVKEIVAINGQVSSTSVVNIVGSGFTGPSSVAVDSSGDVFVSDIISDNVKEIVAVGGQVSSTSAVNVIGGVFLNPFEVALDSSGDVYVAEAGKSLIKVIESVNGGQLSASSPVEPIYGGFAGIFGVALDSSGDMVVSDLYGDTVAELPYSAPPSLSFPTPTKVGTTDTADGPRSVTVANDGNAPLSFPLPASGANPNLSANFTWDNSSTCQQTTSVSSAPYSIATGAFCIVAIDFAPSSPGSISGSLVFFDNSLNTTASQTSALTGTGAAIAPGAPTIGTATAGNAQATVTFAPPSSNGGSTILGYTATSSPGGITGTCAASPCTVTGLTNGVSYTFTVTATNSAGTGPASSPSNPVTPVSPQTITFDNPGTENYGTTPTLHATASSGLPVTFTSSTPTICTVTASGTLAFPSLGFCTINANQAGNAAYLPAPQVKQTFLVQLQ